METKIKTNKLPKGEAVQNFTNYELIGNNPYNRCSAYGKEEMEVELKNGKTLAEVKKSDSIVRGLIPALMNNGYIGLTFLPVFRTRRGKYILLDGHHLFRAIKEVSKMTGERIPINIMVFRESKNFTLGYASQLMCDMNKNGAKPWDFIDIMRSYATPNAKRFVQLFNKYNGVITSAAVIADAVLNDSTTTKRATIEDKWGTTEDTTWGYADEYLNTLTRININRAISQAGADAFRSLFKSCCDNRDRNRLILSYDLGKAPEELG